MRVLFLAHAYPRYAGDPVGSFLLRLAVALANRGVEVTVLAPSAQGLPAVDAIDGIPVHRVRYGPRQFETLAYGGTMAAQVAGSLGGKGMMTALVAATVRAAVGTAGKQRIDLLHAHWWFPGGLAGVAAHAATSRPLVTTIHGSDLRMATSIAGGRSLFRVVARSSAVVTTVSSWLARGAQRLDPNAHPVVAPMPVADYFHPAGQRIANRLLFIGKLDEQKGLHHLLRAMSLLPTTVTLDVVGAGRVEDSHLRRMAEHLGLGARIIWHPLLTQEELATLYRGASVHVIPAVDEGLGLTAVESLLSETPVVAFDSGGIPDVVVDGVTGLLVAPGDHVGLAEAIGRLLGNEPLRTALGTNGRARALATFSPAAVAERYLGVYRSALRAG